VALDHEEGGAVDDVKEFRIDLRAYRSSLRRGMVLSGPETVTDPVGSAADLLRMARSLSRVLLHSWRVTLIGSTPACFHQARSSPTR